MLPVIPPLLEEKLRAQYGGSLSAEIVDGFRQKRPVTLRINRLKTDCDAVTAALENAGIRFEKIPWYEDALILPEAREDQLETLPLYTDGRIYLQSLSAMLPVLLLKPAAADTVLDMAAAPGGKTTQIAALTGGRASITACERDARRCERLRFNLERQGAGRVSVMNVDARRLDDFFSFSSILLDAPCSGSGTVLLLEGEPQRRMEPDWLRKIVSTQKAMLSKALRLLQKGHCMVYSTCSILQDENEDVVRSAIAGGQAELVPVPDDAFPGVPRLPVTLPGTLCVRPDAMHEGFFCAVLRKVR